MLFESLQPWEKAALQDLYTFSRLYPDVPRVATPGLLFGYCQLVAYGYAEARPYNAKAAAAATDNALAARVITALSNGQDVVERFILTAAGLAICETTPLVVERANAFVDFMAATTGQPLPDQEVPND